MSKLTKISFKNPLVISLAISIIFHFSVFQALGTLHFNTSKNSVSFSTPNKYSVAFSPNKSAKESAPEKDTQLNPTPIPITPGVEQNTSAKKSISKSQKLSQKSNQKNDPITPLIQAQQTDESGPKGKPINAHAKAEKNSQSLSQSPSTAKKNASNTADSNTNRQIQHEPNRRSSVFIQNVEYLVMTKPKYPPLAKRLRLEGTVNVLVLIDLEGKPKELSIHKSSDHPILDKAAIKAIKKWRFKPHVIGKKSAEAWAIVPIDFDLRQSK